MSIEILHADEAIVVAVKPSLLLSVPGRGADKQDCLVARLAVEFPGIKEVHRLDWETSGVMVLARTAEAHRELSRQFREREVEKAYIAVVAGEVAEEEGRVDLPLRCDWPNRPRQMVDPDQGKPSQTLWRRLAVEGGDTRLLLTPITGRSHQLRVHMLAIGHPILGDPLYAPADALARAGRLLLHAVRLGFRHPLDSRLLSFESPAPF